jgi:hypothetical protein
MREHIVKLKKENPTWGSKRIAKIVGCSPNTVRYHLNSEHRQRVDANRKARSNRTKVELIQQLGGKCIVCGYDGCPTAFDFHHTDPTQKNDTVSRLMGATNKAIEEAKQCILLCCRCHREIHSGYTKLGV